MAPLADLAGDHRRLARLAGSMSSSEWRRTGAMVGVVVALHVLGFALLFSAVPHHFHIDRLKTFGVGTGLLAYTLGMRHAFDADHIAAIDNTGLHHVTGLIGTLVSGTFLYLITILNVIVLVSILKIFLGLRRGAFDHDELERQLDSRGMLNRFFGPLARRVDTSWKMYPVGVLFGLGFDTATEIALLVLAGTSVASGLPFWAVLSMPILFAAGMALLDTADGTFMNFAYGWAFSNPVRKIYYNITITMLSVAVAFFIGTVELMSVLQSEFGLSGGVWDYSAHFNINSAGFFIVGLFVVTWGVALAVWRFGRIEARFGAADAPAS